MKIISYTFLVCGVAFLAIGCEKPPIDNGTAPPPAYDTREGIAPGDQPANPREPVTHPDPLDPNEPADSTPAIPDNAAQDPTQPGGLLPPEPEDDAQSSGQPPVEGKSRYTDAEPVE